MDEISKQQSFGDLELGVLTLGVALLCVLAVYSYGFATADIFYPNIPVFGGERSISEMKKEFKTKSRALVDAAYKKVFMENKVFVYFFTNAFCRIPVSARS